MGDEMDRELMRQFLLYNLAFNYAVLLVWFIAFTYWHDGLFKLHRRWFALSETRFDAIHYAAMAVYKVGVLLFNLIPYLALLALKN